MLVAAATVAIAALPVTGIAAPYHYTSTPLVASSNSAALNYNVTADGKTFSLSNAVPAAGSVTTTMTAPYAVTSSKATFSNNAVSGNFALNTTAATVVDKATSPTHTLTSISATSSSSIKSFSSVLSYSGISLISISGTKLVSHAKSTLTSKGVATSTGTPVSFGGLSVTASSYLGLTFNPLGFPAAGVPVAANYILAHNANNTLIIYLNHQFTTGTSPHFTSIKVDAIDVYIAPGFSLLGHTAYGDIEIGTSYAD